MLFTYPIRPLQDHLQSANYASHCTQRHKDQFLLKPLTTDIAINKKSSQHFQMQLISYSELIHCFCLECGLSGGLIGKITLHLLLRQSSSSGIHLHAQYHYQHFFLVSNRGRGQSKEIIFIQVEVCAHFLERLACLTSQRPWRMTSQRRFFSKYLTTCLSSQKLIKK